MKKLIFLSLLILAINVQISLSNIIYVNWQASGSNNGTSWTNAYTELQTAMISSPRGSEIWVASGIYKPTTSTVRNISFSFIDGIEIYGGFIGTETQRTQRDWKNNETILSGDIGIIGDSTDNSYSIINGSNTNDTSSVLDGVIIKNGNANLGGSGGGGFYSYTGYMTIRNCTFMHNRGNNSGGAIYNSAGFLNIINCIFINNTAQNGLQGKGGAISNEDSNSSAYIYNCTFTNNHAGFAGGAIYNVKSTQIINCKFFKNYSYNNGGAIFNYSAFGSKPRMINCIFNGNTAEGKGGGIYDYGNSDIINCTFCNNKSINWGATGGSGVYIDNGLHNIINCIFWNNSKSQIFMYVGTVNAKNCLIQGGYTGTNIIDSDSLFVDFDGIDNVPGNEDDNLHLKSISPAINFGTVDTSGLGLPKIDLDGLHRINNQIIDLGPYEWKGTFSSFFSSVKQGCDSMQVSFSDSSTSTGVISSWLWNFGNGTTSKLQNPTANYSNTGIFTVSLTITDSSGTYTKIDSNLIKIFSSYFTQIKKSICKGDSIFIGGSFQDSNGTYYDTLYSIKGCDSIISTILNVIASCNVGVYETGILAKINLYPNPSNGKFIIQMEDIKWKRAEGKIAVYNVLGERVYTSIINNSREIGTSLRSAIINLSALPAGIYFLQVNTGEEIVNRKLVLEK